MKQIVKAFLFFLFLLSLLTLIGRQFLFDLGRVDNYSMAPTLIPGDIFLFRTVGLLGRGDVAVCDNPDEPGTQVVGRIVGIPGDNISIPGQSIRLNGRVIQHQFLDPLIYFDMSTEELMKYVVRIAEEKIGGTLYKVAFMDTSRGQNFREVVVPQDSFFILGDNRNMANDSRNFGFVPIDSCHGEAFFRLWAAENNGDLKQSHRVLSWIH